MWKQLLRLLVAVGCFSAHCPAAQCADIYAELFPLTGEIRLRNMNLTSVSFAFYRISSAAGRLNPSSSVWKSVEDNYDMSGNGLVDPNGEWVKLSSLSTQLTEGALDLDGGSLPPMRAISLGRIWNPDPTPGPDPVDLIFDVREVDEDPINVFIEFALDGDYLKSSSVNASDYAVWRQYYGSTSILLADGNLDGEVNAADYLIWRKNLGKTITGPPYGSGAGSEGPGFAAAISVVPEPASLALVLVAAVSSCLIVLFQRTRASTRR